MKRLIKAIFFDGFKNKDKNYDIFKNPTTTEVNIVKEQDEDGYIRGLINHSGEVYIWASEVLHNKVPINDYGIHFNFDGDHIEFDFDGEATEKNIYQSLQNSKLQLNKIGIDNSTNCSFGNDGSNDEIEEIMEDFYKIHTYGDVLIFIKKGEL